MLEDKCHCCQSLNFSETALITLMEEPCRMAVVGKPWSYCWCKRRARARAALPNLSLMANTGPQRPSCFAPGNCGGETFSPANTERKGLGCSQGKGGGKGEQIRWSVETRWAGGRWRRWRKVTWPPGTQKVACGPAHVEKRWDKNALGYGNDFLNTLRKQTFHLSQGKRAG